MKNKRKQRCYNRNRYFLCPFFKWDGIDFVSCEAGHPRIYDKATAEAYMSRYCCADWKHCTLAAELLKYYDEILNERQPPQKEETHREKFYYLP